MPADLFKVSSFRKQYVLQLARSLRPKIRGAPAGMPHPGANDFAGADRNEVVYIQNVFPHAPRLLQSTRI